MNKQNDAITNMKDSAFDFKRLIAPIILKKIGGGKIISIESLGGEKVAKIFDSDAGIDAIQIKTDKGIRGTASRIQWDWREDFRSFTQRYKLTSGYDTEYDKKKRAIKTKSGWFYPYWTSQGYVTQRRKGDLLYLCMMKTEDLYDYIDEHPEEIKIQTNPEDGNKFIIAWANHIKKHYPIYIYENKCEIAKFTRQNNLFDTKNKGG